MSFIFFNYRLTDNETEGQAFVVNNAEAKYWDENKNNLGYPTSNKMTDSITLPPESPQPMLKRIFRKVSSESACVPSKSLDWQTNPMSE